MLLVLMETDVWSLATTVNTRPNVNAIYFAVANE